MLGETRWGFHSHPPISASGQNHPLLRLRPLGADGNRGQREVAPLLGHGASQCRTEATGRPTEVVRACLNVGITVLQTHQRTIVSGEAGRWGPLPETTCDQECGQECFLWFWLGRARPGEKAEDGPVCVTRAPGRRGHPCRGTPVPGWLGQEKVACGLPVAALHLKALPSQALVSCLWEGQSLQDSPGPGKPELQKYIE